MAGVPRSTAHNARKQIERSIGWGGWEGLNVRNTSGNFGLTRRLRSLKIFSHGRDVPIIIRFSEIDVGVLR